MIELPRYIDTHCHLNLPEFGEEWQKTIPRALDEGAWLILVGHDYVSSARAIEIAREFPYGVYASVGLHPALVERGEVSPQNFGIEAFREFLDQPKVVAIGELGLDVRQAAEGLDEERLFHKQEEALRQFFALAETHRLPLILQTTGAHDKLLRFLSWFRGEGRGLHLRGILHHFTGSWQRAGEYIALDVFPTLTGLIAHSHVCHDLIKRILPEHLLVESECPRLVVDAARAPRPLPAHLPGVFGYIAGLRGEAEETMRSIATKNALRLFPKIFRSL